MKKTTLLFLLFTFRLSIYTAYCQDQHRIDSLQKEVAKYKAIKEKKLTNAKALADTVIAKVLFNISFAYWGSNSDKSMDYANQCLSFSEKIGFKKGISLAYTSMGVINEDKGQYPEALKYYEKALDISREIHNKKGESSALGNIGNVYMEQGNYSKALKYQFDDLKLAEEIKDSNLIANCYTNIGNICLSQGNNEDALENYKKGLIIQEKIKDPGISYSYLSIGNIYLNQKKYTQALTTYKECLKIVEKSGDKNLIAKLYNNIGWIYETQGNKTEALKSYMASLKLKEKMGDEKGIINSDMNISDIYSQDKKWKEALSFSQKALALAKKIGNSVLIKDTYFGLATINSKMGNYKGAYENEISYHNLLDTIASLESTKKTAELKVKYEYKNIELIKQAEQDKKDALAQKEIQKQKNLRNSLFAGFTLMIILAVVSFRSFRRKQKDNLIIGKQKELVENKNKEITKSIQYALRIQNAILPPARSVRESFTNSFIVYKPKDIVAGDFYWMEASEDFILFAACDCTGHGVPGAMVSVVCHNALNRAVREFGLTKPSAILDKTAAIVIENFSKSEDEIRDGMDISLCAFNIKTKTLEWAGANNPLWIIKNGELIETKADKQPIGMHENYHPFTNHQFTLNEGDSIYLFTDGYSDQFGTVDGKQKKLTRKRFKDLLLSIQMKSMKEQGSRLEDFITYYQNDLEQIDDILVMGVRV